MPLTALGGSTGTVVIGDTTTTVFPQTLHPTVMNYIAAMSSPTGGNYAMSVNEIDAVNNMVQALVANGLWTKIQAIYPFIGNSAAAHKYNLKDPQDTNAAFRLSFLGGGWIHTTTGAKPNGTSSYANTFYQQSVSGSLTNHHLSYYSRTNTNASQVEIGSVQGFNNRSFIQMNVSGTTYVQVTGNVATFLNWTDANSLGFYLANRTASALINGWKNGLKQSQATTLPSGVNNNANAYFLGAYNNGVASFFSSKECALASIGEGFTDVQAVDYYRIVQAFQQKLGRQV